MKSLTFYWSTLLLLTIPAGKAAPASTNAPLNFKEVYRVLKENLHGISDAELDQAAAQGLLDRLAGRVSLAPEKLSDDATNSPALSQVLVYDRSYGYLRVGKVEPKLESQFSEACRGLAATNRLKGIVLDLRYVSGDDYAAAAQVADRFLSTEQPLIDYGDGVKKSTIKTNAVVLPVAILVNNKTAGAAEALAAILRKTEVGLLLGATTAGRASISKEITLQTGHQLRVAVASIKVANGETMPAGGIVPDIQVTVAPEDELAWFQDPYSSPKTNLVAAALGDSGTGTNRTARRRINEAELVRMMKEGVLPDPDPTAPGKEVNAGRPLLRDPALARAIDLLKGLAVVQQFRAL